MSIGMIATSEPFERACSAETKTLYRLNCRVVGTMPHHRADKNLRRVPLRHSDLGDTPQRFICVLFEAILRRLAALSVPAG